jgi:hypothetical protein
MITINNLKEMKKYYDKQTNTYVFYDDVEFTIDIDVESNIDAYNIEAKNIYARDINAYNIDAWNICAHDINARDINACNIEAHDINAQDINAHDINAYNINAWNIDYYAYCIAYYIFKCKSAKSSRDNSICKCLDGKIEYIK